MLCYFVKVVSNMSVKETPSNLESENQSITSVIFNETSKKKSDSIYNYNDAFEMTGTGMFSYLVLLSCSLIFVYSIIEMAAVAYIVTPAECDLNLTLIQKTLINTGVYFGMISMSVIWGELGDRYGRRRVMLPSLFAAVLASILSSFADAFWSMFLLRICTGCLVSASSATVLVYLGELQVMAFRDTAIALAVLSAQFSFLILPGIAWLLIPSRWSFNMIVLIRPWRVFMWTWSLVALAGASILYILPESPNFLMIRKGSAAAIPVLAKMYAWNHSKDPRDYPVKTIIAKHEHQAGIIVDLIQLVRLPMRRCFAITHCCMFLVFLLANGLYSWVPDFINDMLADFDLSYGMCALIHHKYLADPVLTDEEKGKSDDCDAGEVNLYLYPTTMAVESVTLIPFVIVAIYIHRTSKAFMYAFMMSACAVCLLLSSFIPQIVAAEMFFIVGICGGSGCSLLSALVVDSFPTSIRALAMNTMYAAAHIGAIFGTAIVNIMDGPYCYILFVLFTIMMIGSSVAIMLYWPNMSAVKAKMEARGFTY